jgi:hypothetical protein
MTDSSGDDNGDGLESQLEAENLELTLATLRAERARLVAQYERRIAEVGRAIERVEAAAIVRDQPAPKEKPSKGKEPAEGKAAPKPQPRARAPRKSPPRKPHGSR